MPDIQHITLTAEASAEVTRAPQNEPEPEAEANEEGHHDG